MWTRGIEWKPNINPHTYGQIIFDKDAKTGKGQLVLGKQALEH